MNKVVPAVRIFFRTCLETLRQHGVRITLGIAWLFVSTVWLIWWRVGGALRQLQARADETGVGPVWRRTEFSKFRGDWSLHVWRRIRRGLRINEYVEVADALHELGGQPALVVANHNVTFEILILVALLSEMKLNVHRFVSKSSLAKAPIVGPLLRECGDALVRPSERGDDLQEIREKARLAKLDDASVVIFPEGTRFKGPKDGAKRMHVGEPKVAGYATLRKQLATYPVLAVCFHWVDMAPGEGRTMMEPGHFWQKTLRITARVYGHEYLSGDPTHELAMIFDGFEEELSEPFGSQLMLLNSHMDVSRDRSASA